MKTALLMFACESHILGVLINKGDFMSNAFDVGDLVKLKSGGPDMTIQSVNNSAAPYTYWCQWFAGRKLERGNFSEASLESAENGEG